MIDTRLLYYFMAVARERNFTKAAEFLHITQPSLSKQIQLLEDQMGCRLFIRGRNITLTNEGEYLRAQANDILQLTERTEETLRSGFIKIKGTVELGMSIAMSTYHMSEAAQLLRSEHPDVKINMHLSEPTALISDIKNGLIDIGITNRYEKIPRYNIIDMHQDNKLGFAISVNNPLSQKQFLSKGDLGNTPIMYNRFMISKKEHDEIVAGRYPAPNIIGSYDILNQIMVPLENNLIVAFTSEDRMQVLNGSLLRFVPIYPIRYAHAYLIFKRYHTLSPAAQKLLDYYIELTGITVE